MKISENYETESTHTHAHTHTHTRARTRAHRVSYLKQTT